MVALPSHSYSSPDGVVALIGTGAAAIGVLWMLRAAGLSVRWFCGNPDVAEEVLFASAPPGSLELVFADPRVAKLGDNLAAVVCAAGSPLDEVIASRARESAMAVNVVGRPDLSTFHIEAALKFSTTKKPRAPAEPTAAQLLEHAP